MDEFTIWTIVFIVVVGGLNYLLRGYADKSGRSNSTGEYKSSLNWMNDVNQSYRLGNRYHDERY